MLTILASFGCAGQYRRMAALSVVFRLTVCGRTRPAAAPAGSDWLNPTLKRPSDLPQADTRRMSRCRSEFRREFQSMTSLVMCVFQSVCV